MRRNTYAAWVRMSLECNGLRGSWTFDAAERLASFLLALGRTLDPNTWVDGLIIRGGQDANADAMGKFV